MVKVYYTVELSSKTIYNCKYELRDYTLGKDYQTIYYRDTLAYHGSSILPELINLKYHLTSSEERIIDGKKVESIAGLYFGE